MWSTLQPFALARAGELSESQKLAADLEKRFRKIRPYSSNIFRRCRLFSRSFSMSLWRRWSGCSARFPTTSRWLAQHSLEDSEVSTLHMCAGEAYLSAGRGQEAAAEFQKVLNHRGIVLADPIGVLAHLQMGRAYALSGDNVKAKAAYQQFLTLWDHADEDIPVLRQAKEQYAKLP